jgi:hypothetical protein
MIDLFYKLNDAKAYKSREAAQQKLDSLEGAIPANCTTFVAQRPSDNKWLAVVIYKRDEVMNIPFLCGKGICITD